MLTEDKPVEADAPPILDADTTEELSEITKVPTPVDPALIVA